MEFLRLLEGCPKDLSPPLVFAGKPRRVSPEASYVSPDCVGRHIEIMRSCELPFSVVEARLAASRRASHGALPRWPLFSRFSYYNSFVEIHSSARKHGVGDEDIEHAIDNVMSIDDQDDDSRLYLGPARNADLLEVVTIVRDDGSELVIHAMKMRPKYRRLLPGD